MKKRNRNIKNIFIMLQRGTNIMSNQVKISIQNYFEKSVVWKFDIWDSSLVVFKSCQSRDKKNIVTSSCDSVYQVKITPETTHARYIMHLYYCCYYKNN